MDSENNLKKNLNSLLQSKELENNILAILLNRNFKLNEPILKIDGYISQFENENIPFRCFKYIRKNRYVFKFLEYQFPIIISSRVIHEREKLQSYFSQLSILIPNSNLKMLLEKMYLIKFYDTDPYDICLNTEFTKTHEKHLKTATTLLKRKNRA